MRVSLLTVMLGLLYIALDEGSHANEMPVGSAVIAFNAPDKCGDGQSCMIKDGDIANLKQSMPGLVDK
jgi:hypothetical protein